MEEKKIRWDVENLISQDRVLNFSDSVFAFAATLLVLKIDLPEIQASNLQLWPAIYTLAPQYLANLLSFLVIGYYWLNHHAIFGMIKKYNSLIVWLNLIFLLLVSFLPFPVDLYGDYFQNKGVVVFYSVSLAVVGLMLALIWGYASDHHHLVSPDMSQKKIKYYMYRNLLAPVVFLLSIPLVWVHPLLAQASWIFVIIGIIAINRYFGKLA